jgi:DNA-binding GntR family transcriptional regulator
METFQFSWAGQAIAAGPFAYILCDHLEALPTDYLSMAEDHQDVLRAMMEGPEAAARATRNHIEEWLNHSRRALQQTAAKADQPSFTEATRVL